MGHDISFLTFMAYKKMSFSSSFYYSHILRSVFLVCVLKFLVVHGKSAIIVGAGTAGVSAATRLLQNGFDDILILEAQNRIGGKLHSVFFGEAYVDLCPRHVMGSHGNIVYETVKHMGILQKVDLASDMYYSKNQKIDRDLQNEIVDIIYNWRNVPDFLRGELYNVSTATYYLKRFYTTKMSLFDGREYLIKPTLRFIEQEYLRDTAPKSWFTRPLINDYEEIPGGLLVWSGHGYITFLNTLIKNLPKTKQKIFHKNLLFNKFVKKINWKRHNHKKITVECSDGSEYSADYVIFTPSSGILKNHNREIFNPNLPPPKQKAIKRLLIGGEHKIVLRYPTRWWPKNDNFTGFYLLWAEDDIKKVYKEFPAGVLQNGYVWVQDIFLATAEKNNTNVLICWIASREMIKVELLSNQILVDGCDYAMFKFFKHKFKVVKSDAYIMSRAWISRYYEGPYSFQSMVSVKGENSDNVVLEKPLVRNQNSALMFAGEATHPIYFQTVHGACESGYREADRIINNDFT